MSDSNVGPARLVLDHELLWRLDPTDPPAEWERTLRRAGLWTLAQAENQHGRQVRELVATVEAWSAECRERESFAAEAWAALSILAGSRQPGERARRLARRAHRLLRSVLGRTFIEIHGEVLVENVPHRDYLLLRIGEVEAAAAACRARADEMTRTRDGIRVANARLGRQAHDAETERLDEAIRLESVQAERVDAILLDLRARLARLEAELETARMYAERRALSERASRLTESPSANAAMRVASEIEVDVATIEAEVAGVLSGAREEDARLRAVLEVVGAGRR